MSSVMVPITDLMDVWNANVVKVVTDQQGICTLFLPLADSLPAEQQRGDRPWKRHLGLYGYRREFLLKFTSLPRTPLEITERLEQLRALEHGYRIKMVEFAEDHSIGVDTPEDLQRVLSVLETQLARSRGTRTDLIEFNEARPRAV